MRLYKVCNTEKNGGSAFCLRPTLSELSPVGRKFMLLLQLPVRQPCGNRVDTFGAEGSRKEMPGRHSTQEASISQKPVAKLQLGES